VPHCFSRGIVLGCDARPSSQRCAVADNNLGAGVGAGVAGVPALATTLLAGTFSLLAVGGGSRIGSSVGRSVFGRIAPLIAGLVLLAVGCATLPGVGY
jgi:putative Mn2+ efflux pump MntP